MDRRISVIMILYYSKHLLSDILANVFEKVEDVGEIVLINNSKENIDEYASEIVSVHYSESNLGYGAAINFAVTKCRYDLLLILNPDLHIDKFDIKKDYRQHYFVMSGHNPDMPGYSMKFPTLLATFVSNALSDFMNSKRLHRLMYFRKVNVDAEEVKVDYISGALIFTNKITFFKIGGFNIAFFLFYEETEFCRRAKFHGIPVISTLKIVYSSCLDKSSSIDVSKIKIRSGIESAIFYHKMYDGILLTAFVFAVLKLYYALIIIFLLPASYLNKRISDFRNTLRYRLQYL